MKNITKEKVQGIIIVILLLIIAFGGSYFASEVKKCGDNTETKAVELTSISYKEYKEIKKQDELSIIYIARPGCSFCQQQQPIVKQIMQEYDITVNYLNTDDMTQDEADELINSYDVFEGGKNFGTPTILLVQKNKIIDSVIGYTEKTSLLSFFEEHKIIEK